MIEEASIRERTLLPLHVLRYLFCFRLFKRTESGVAFIEGTSINVRAQQSLPEGAHMHACPKKGGNSVETTVLRIS